MERVDEDRSLRGLAARDEVEGEADARARQPEPARDLEPHDGERHGDPPTTFEHVRQVRVAQVGGPPLVALQPHVLVEIRRQPRHALGGGQAVVDEDPRVVHEPLEVRVDLGRVEVGVPLGRDGDGRRPEVGARGIGHGFAERVHGPLAQQRPEQVGGPGPEDRRQGIAGDEPSERATSGRPRVPKPQFGPEADPGVACGEEREVADGIRVHPVRVPPPPGDPLRGRRTGARIGVGGGRGPQGAKTCQTHFRTHFRTLRGLIGDGVLACALAGTVLRAVG